MIFRSYLKLGSLNLLMADLRKQGIVTKVRTLKTGATVGGIPFTRGPLAHLLRNRFYIGEVPNLGDDALLAQVGHQQVEAAKLEITAEDHAHPVRLRLVDGDPSLVGVVAERDHAADPEPLALGR